MEEIVGGEVKFVSLHFINSNDCNNYFNNVTFRRYLNIKRQYYKIHKDQTLQLNAIYFFTYNKLILNIL